MAGSAREKRFEDLRCWKAARKFARRVYRLTLKGGFSKDFNLMAEVRSAGVSAMANIAEGWGSRSDNEFRRFLGYAIRSLYEAESHLYVALDQRYITEEEFKTAFDEAEKVIALLKDLVEKLLKKMAGYG